MQFFKTDIKLKTRLRVQSGCGIYLLKNNGKEKRLVEGHIKWYDEKKGYGFVTTAEHGDIFLHNSGIKEFGYFGLQSNDPVIFEIRETSKGKQAVNLKPFKASTRAK